MINEEDFKPHDTIGGVITNDKNEIFILYHHKYNLYSIPVGKVIEGEFPGFSLIREIKEELGIDVTHMDLIGSGYIKYNLDNTILESVAIIFEVHSYDGIIENIEPDKHSNFKFVSIDELKKLKKENKLTEITKMYLNYLNR